MICGCAGSFRPTSLAARILVDGVEAARTVVTPKGSGPVQKRFTHVLPREGGPAVHNVTVNSNSVEEAPAIA